MFRSLRSRPHLARPLFADSLTHEEENFNEFPSNRERRHCFYRFYCFSCRVWLHLGSVKRGGVGREVNHGMESIAPSSKTATSVIVVAPWEQKAQWKRRGTHRQRQGGRGGERPQEENGRLSDSVKVERETNLLAARQERQMKLFWHHPIHRSTVDRNRVTRATYCPVHVMCVLPPLPRRLTPTA